jgi:hypothetical protein
MAVDGEDSAAEWTKDAVAMCSALYLTLCEDKPDLLYGYVAR